MPSIIRSHVEHLGFTLPDLVRPVPVFEEEFVKVYGPSLVQKMIDRDWGLSRD